MPPGEWPTEERELVIQRLRTIHEVLDGSRARWVGHRPPRRRDEQGARARGFQAGFFLARPAPCPGDAPKGL